MRQGNSRQLSIIFLAVVVPAAATLVWLGWTLLEQDRILFHQRELEIVADSVARRLSKSLADAEQRVHASAEFHGVATVSRGGQTRLVSPRSLILWVSPAAPLPEIPTDPFELAESHEYQGRREEALRMYRRLAAAATEQRIRAGALLRSARVLRNSGDLDGATIDYRALSAIDSVAHNGMPTDLLARRAICEIFAMRGEKEHLEEEAGRLARDVVNGRWSLGGDAAELVVGEVGAWLGRSVAPTPAALEAAYAVESFLKGLWPRTSGSQNVNGAGSPMTVITRTAGPESRALIIAPSILKDWAAQIEHDSNGRLGISLIDDHGVPLTGRSLPSPSSAVRRTPADTGLPWTLALSAAQGWRESREFRDRRRLFTAGIAALGLLFAGGSYLLWRVVQREIAVASLQAEFVSAVSHEFRTPVTSLRHVIELLQEDDDVPKERRLSFYDVLARNTERLDRLVESLLDFGRMESGRKAYNLQPLDVHVLVQDVVREFEAAPAARGYRVELNTQDPSGRTVMGDATSLGHALWNLLDNAVKYSPDRGRVSVTVRSHGNRNVAIDVIDDGIGVPRSERGEIFQKFVRGAQASRLGIKGTGVGLAMVAHIIRAHGGTIELDSREGHGSTFTLVLPVTS